ncbi:hypothetical protein HY570_00555 [Candidatus Micrarchaeota archaeon]|nr:hypothetical protein [Candidatus Micrarchaeota archaeon]
MEIKKAFVFTLDAVFGLLLAIMLLTSVTNILYISSKNISPILMPLQRTSQDVLNTLDKEGSLDSLFSQSSAQGNATLLNALNETLPPNIGGKIEVWLCTYVGDGGTGGGDYDDEDDDCDTECETSAEFSCSTYLRGIISGPSTYHVGVSRRLFTINQTSYGYAVMKTWYR